ncbi:MAG: DNA polymerase III subunit alpha [Bacteroidaceae bacterium]|nr:DNA polymerase III subunit alpha [Bacteroidaceae bacterium]MDO5488703.1 DNA polymerase III subunit alpha [Bacteroidaceae bacterium]
MQDFVHLHVHSQYSLLDGMASIPKLVDKAIADGMRGMAITDHGNMMGVKELFNYTNKKNGPVKDEIKGLKEQLAKLEKEENPDATTIEELRNGIKEAQKRLFKPIFGCEMYCARRGKEKKSEKIDQSGWHLIVLAKNEKGYHNLIKLVSRSYVDGFYMRPRTDHEDLERFREGLIICSACIGGELPKKIQAGDMEGALQTASWFKSIWGDDYYIELQRHEVKNPAIRANRDIYPLQMDINRGLLEVARQLDIKIICSNDSHFVDEENAEAHDRLLCLGTNRDVDDQNRMLYSKQEWFKTKAEMNEIFSDLPEALDNTCEVLDKVEFYSIDHPPIMPNFAIPKDFGTEEEYMERFTDEQLFDEFTHDENGNEIMSAKDAQKKVEKLGGVKRLYRLKLEADYLAHLAYEGAKKIYGEPLPEVVTERMKFELHIMKTMGFPGYFLIVQDYINAARHELNVSVGPGRGSAAGSEVAYCLGITKVDPIKYDLLFERFLNPDRISLPDIDVDFDDDGRGKVLSWVTQKYGEEKVTHIITYGTMATKMAIKDVARVQKVPLNISNDWCKAIPDRLPDDSNGNPRKMNLKNCLECVPALAEAQASPNPAIRDTIKYAQMLEGNVRNLGVHACGVIICRDDVSDWVPISTAEDKETGERLSCTQYEGSVIEDTGLIKMDFLGLKNLSTIKECVANIKESLGMDVNVDTLDIEDAATYKLYCDGRTIGTFQFESAGMQKYLRELQPSTFEDLIAMNALYRPGPMDYIPDFIDRKHGRKPVEYDIPCMEKYLKDTYGITVYQEQVMLLSRQLANFTRGESDTLRKAMGKKLRKKLDEMKPQFINQGKANGHDPNKLEKIWTDWEKFASYAFNKSHATCYSWVAYQTAYLKANFPAEYMAANMSRNLSNISEITKLMSECKAMGILCLGPDVNKSFRKFSVDMGGDVRFGLGAVKGLGEGAVEIIIKEREQNGPYKSLFDFVHRIPMSAIKRNGMECLVLSGALDCFEEIKREQYFAPNAKGEVFIDVLIRYATGYQVAMEEAQNSLFGGVDEVEIHTPDIPAAEQWSALEKLNKERELVGIYLSAHPLDEYSIILNQVCNLHLGEMDNLAPFANQDLYFGGIVTGVRQGMSKRGSAFGIVTLEDYSGAHELPLFGNDWVQWSSFMIEGNLLYITARCQARQYDSSKLELKIGRIDFLSDVKDKLIENITINMPVHAISKDLVCTLQKLTAENGPVTLRMCITDAEGNTLAMQSQKKRITVKKELISFIEKQTGMSFKIN